MLCTTYYLTIIVHKDKVITKFLNHIDVGLSKMVVLKTNLQSNPDLYLIEIKNSDDNQGIKTKAKPIEIFENKKSMADCLDGKVEKELNNNPESYRRGAFQNGCFKNKFTK